MKMYKNVKYFSEPAPTTAGEALDIHNESREIIILGEQLYSFA